MTIQSTSNTSPVYPGAGSTGPFAFTFKVFTSADVVVLKADTDGSETELTLTTHYTISLNGDQDASPGGSITLLTALAVGESLVIQREVNATQLIDLQTGGGFYPQVIENALDKLTMLHQQSASATNRALTLSAFAAEGVSTSLPAPSGNKVIGWNSAGDALVNLNAGDLATSIVGANKVIDVFSGNGATTTFTLSAEPSTENNTLVFISGVYQQKSQYSVAGNQITFTSAPPSGSSNIEVEQFEAVTYPVTAVGTNVVGTPQIVNAAVTEAKLADGSVTVAKLASGVVLDEDAMTSNSATAAPSQQSVKAYVDAQVATKDIATQVAPGTAGNVLTSDGSAWVSSASTAGITLNASSSASGVSSVVFTGIPSTAKRVTMKLDGVSMPDTNWPKVRLGTGTTPQTSGYNATAFNFSSGAAQSDAFRLRNASGTAADGWYGLLIFEKFSPTSDTWMCCGVVSEVGSTNGGQGISGSVALSGALGCIELLNQGTGVNFDAGSVSIAWE